MACLSFLIIPVAFYFLSDSNISPSPANFTLVPPIEGTPGPAYHRKSWRTSAPSPSSEPNGNPYDPGTIECYIILRASE